MTALLWMGLGLGVSSIGPCWKFGSWHDVERWRSLEVFGLSMIIRSEKLSQRRNHVQ